MPTWNGKPGAKEALASRHPPVGRPSLRHFAVLVGRYAAFVCSGAGADRVTTVDRSLTKHCHGTNLTVQSSCKPTVDYLQMPRPEEGLASALAPCTVGIAERSCLRALATRAIDRWKS